MSLVFESDALPYYENMYLGIDQSLTCTSLAFFQYGKMEIVQIKPKTTIQVPRLGIIRDEFIEHVQGLPLAGAAIEGYAMGAVGRTFNLGEVGGLLRLVLWDNKTNAIEVPPKTLKKYVSGNGNAKKELVMASLLSKYGIDIKDNNDADAAGLALYVAEYFETEYHFLNNYRSEVHLKARQIIGEHPKPLSLKEYTRAMGDMQVHEVEKKRRGGKKKPVVRKNDIK